MKQNMKSEQQQALLMVQDVARLTGLGMRTIQRWCSTEKYNFPKPVKLGRLLRWRSNEIQAWIAGETK